LLALFVICAASRLRGPSLSIASNRHSSFTHIRSAAAANIASDMSSWNMRPIAAFVDRGRLAHSAEPRVQADADARGATKKHADAPYSVVRKVAHAYRRLCSLRTHLRESPFAYNSTYTESANERPFLNVARCSK
jgi:hypothetical protein